MIKVMLFYLGIGTDHKNRRIADYLNADNQWWERTHDFIQWAFPNSRPSRFNYQAPLLTKQLRWFLKNPVSKRLHKKLLLRAASFFLADLSVIAAGDHNLLRISRILHFCTEMGIDFTIEETIFNVAINSNVPIETIIYWLNIRRT